MAATVLKQLGQARPADLLNVSIYSPGASVSALIKNIVVSNSSGSVVNCRIFHDEDGTTYDETTQVVWDMDIPAGSPVFMDVFFGMINAAALTMKFYDRFSRLDRPGYLSILGLLILRVAFL